MTPVGRNLLIKHLAKEEVKTPAGLILPDKKTDDPLKATVLKIGGEVEYPIKEGDTVLVSPYSGIPIKITDEEGPRLIVDRDVILILN